MIVSVSVIHARVGEKFPATFEITTETSKGRGEECFPKGRPVGFAGGPIEGIFNSIIKTCFSERVNARHCYIRDCLLEEIDDVFFEKLTNIFCSVFNPFADFLKELCLDFHGRGRGEEESSRDSNVVNSHVCV